MIDNSWQETGKRQHVVRNWRDEYAHLLAATTTDLLVLAWMVFGVQSFRRCRGLSEVTFCGNPNDEPVAYLAPEWSNVRHALQNGKADTAVVTSWSELSPDDECNVSWGVGLGWLDISW